MKISDSEPSLENQMLAAHGELITGKALRAALGYQSDRTFARAIQCAQLPVSVFKLEKRRGHFARTRDVALWLKGLGDE